MECIINLGDKNSKETYWILLFIDKNIAIYFDSFGSEYILKEVLNKIKDKSVTRNIFSIQNNESISILKTNVVEQATLECSRLRKVDETRNFLLYQIKHDLVSV